MTESFFAKAFERYKQYARGKLRVWSAWLALVLLAYFIRQAPSWNGTFVIIAGAFVRFLASGYIDKEGKLSTRGIYRYMRNPLYLGSFLIAFGAALSQDDLFLIALITVLNFMVYYPLILAEEDVLKIKFQGPYQEYCARVPRFFPWKFIPSLPHNFFESDPRLNRASFSAAKIKENKGYEGFFTAAGVIAFLYVVCYFKHLL